MDVTKDKTKWVGESMDVETATIETGGMAGDTEL